MVEVNKVLSAAQAAIANKVDTYIKEHLSAIQKGKENFTQEEIVLFSNLDSNNDKRIDKNDLGSVAFQLVKFRNNIKEYYDDAGNKIKDFDLDKSGSITSKDIQGLMGVVLKAQKTDVIAATAQVDVKAAMTMALNYTTSKDTVAMGMLNTSNLAADVIDQFKTIAAAPGDETLKGYKLKTLIQVALRRPEALADTREVLNSMTNGKSSGVGLMDWFGSFAVSENVNKESISAAKDLILASSSGMNATRPFGASQLASKAAYANIGVLCGLVTAKASAADFVGISEVAKSGASAETIKGYLDLVNQSKTTRKAVYVLEPTISMYKQLVSEHAAPELFTKLVELTKYADRRDFDEMNYPVEQLNTVNGRPGGLARYLGMLNEGKPGTAGVYAQLCKRLDRDKQTGFAGFDWPSGKKIEYVSPLETIVNRLESISSSKGAIASVFENITKSGGYYDRSLDFIKGINLLSDNTTELNKFVDEIQKSDNKDIVYNMSKVNVKAAMKLALTHEWVSDEVSTKLETADISSIRAEFLQLAAADGDASLRLTKLHTLVNVALANPQALADVREAFRMINSESNDNDFSLEKYHKESNLRQFGQLAADQRNSIGVIKAAKSILLANSTEGQTYWNLSHLDYFKYNGDFNYPGLTTAELAEISRLANSHAGVDAIGSYLDRLQTQKRGY